jgi:lysozyme family protein
MNIETILDNIIKKEGGYSNNSADKGGETNFGITKATAMASGYFGPMKDLPLVTAKEIYTKLYINAPGFNLLLPLSEKVAMELIDTGVNMGVLTSGKFLQRSLNVLDQANLIVDGIVGNATRNALRTFLNKRSDDGEQILLKALNCLQGAGYIELAENNPNNREFICGWLRNRVEI